MFLSQGLLLFQYLTKAPCEATISQTLCLYLRFTCTFSIFSLPTLNLTLMIFRIVNYLVDYRMRKKENKIRRIFMLFALLLISIEYYWKYYGFVIVEAQVAYCIVNSKALVQKSNTEALITLIFEVITVLTAFLLVALYRRNNKLKPSYIISVNLTRRQLVKTMHLFLPYSGTHLTRNIPFSFLHAISFSTFPLIGSAYRTIFINLLDEVSYAAGSGFTFIPMYFIVIAPWLIYWIVVNSERGRVTNTKILLNLEMQAKDVYFASYRNQWEEEARKKDGEKDGCFKMILVSFRLRKVSFSS